MKLKWKDYGGYQGGMTAEDGTKNWYVALSNKMWKVESVEKINGWYIRRVCVTNFPTMKEAQEKAESESTPS